MPGRVLPTRRFLDIMSWHLLTDNSASFLFCMLFAFSRDLSLSKNEVLPFSGCVGESKSYNLICTQVHQGRKYKLENSTRHIDQGRKRVKSNHFCVPKYKWEHLAWSQPVLLTENRWGKANDNSNISLPSRIRPGKQRISAGHLRKG